MSRKRILIEYGIYHVFNRGHNKMKLFKDDEDNDVFLKIVREVQNIYHFRVFARCLMGNHYHFLIQDVKKNLPDAIGLIQEKYAIYYKAKYNHSGAVFMKPFKSKLIFSRLHFFTALSYILNNPVKVDIVEEYTEYMWNSPLVGYEKYNLTDYLYVKFLYKPILGLSLHDYIKRRSKSKKISDMELDKMSDSDAKLLFNKIVKEYSNCDTFSSELITILTQKEIIKEARYQGINTRQLSDFTGKSKSAIRANKPTKSYL